MQKKNWLLVLLFFSISFVSSLAPSSAQAESQDQGDMDISFKGMLDPGYGILDPEHPEKTLNPGVDYGKTSGPLRIDFVPNFQFGRSAINLSNMSYSANALLFEGEIAPRGQFIQISDYREGQTGWSLQVRQDTQFTNIKDSKTQLDGAVLSFDNSWVSTRNGASRQPDVSKEVIRLDNLGETYTLAHSPKGTGNGTWSIVFGASKDNPEDESGTINPRLDKNGNIISDPQENQALYMNNAVRLSLPGKTKKKPGTYATVLTWIISELP
ncbi:WxL domain-containing protein [Enterococcus caccae]|uniref:WxL domain-containing protein n=1 Tax=Enterococcus caccae ATCC BAA-1240 TaxID=1158612 RepID=R3X8S5_9ENTE|nr:WxL domain-containing protein [Enterococcus caccae]EOL50470.1 hypothetical protein UC7_00463 [Enterococcus caccae ATCC BAA-1240]EOT59093.1 hypothetical protein I580_02125 [Enterococcus caccae ATCC BAA-1240]OJG25625.1 hypothetical protein RU98_GL000866 [Enterococcus caccae]